MGPIGILTSLYVTQYLGIVCSFVAASLGLAAAERFGYPAVAPASLVLVAAGVAVGVTHQRRFPAATLIAGTRADPPARPVPVLVPAP
ncbi:hypothetical protein [Micromonospora tulbaghiae]